MLRLLPLLVFALLPAAVAAPVPAPAPPRPEFGANGLLTEADLEKVEFDSRLVKEDERVLEKELEEVKKVREVRKDEKERPEKERPENRFDVAVHIPRATFREGGPAPAYFVLRNNRARELGLRSRLDLCPEPRLYGGSTTFDIRDRATGKSVVTRLAACTHCGGGSLVDVPADGYYCLKVDVNHLAGQVLPPGRYEVEWGYRQFRAAPVSFTVIERDSGKPAPLAKRPALRFFHLREGDGDENGLQAEREDRAICWADSDLEWVHANGLAAALAVGQVGVYVPDIYTIPAADKLIEARAEWKPYRDGDRVAITLSAAVAGKMVEFDELPQLYLQLETPANSEDGDERELGERKRAASDALQLRTPLTIEVRLPDDWRSRVGPNGPARVSVLVVSKELELPRGDLRAIKQLDRLYKLNADEVPVWSGVVRTAPTALHLPLPMFAKPTR